MTKFGTLYLHLYQTIGEYMYKLAHVIRYTGQGVTKFLIFAVLE